MQYGKANPGMLAENLGHEMHRIDPAFNPGRIQDDLVTWIIYLAICYDDLHPEDAIWMEDNLYYDAAPYIGKDFIEKHICEIGTPDEFWTNYNHYTPLSLSEAIRIDTALFPQLRSPDDFFSKKLREVYRIAGTVFLQDTNRCCRRTELEIRNFNVKHMLDSIMDIGRDNIGPVIPKPKNAPDQQTQLYRLNELTKILADTFGKDGAVIKPLKCTLSEYILYLAASKGSITADDINWIRDNVSNGPELFDALEFVKGYRTLDNFIRDFEMKPLGSLMSAAIFETMARKGGNTSINSDEIVELYHSLAYSYIHYVGGDDIMYLQEAIYDAILQYMVWTTRDYPELKGLL